MNGTIKQWQVGICLFEAALACGVSPARAEPSAPLSESSATLPSALELVTRAREHGHAGLSAFERQDWEAAHELFVAAEEAMHSPVFLLYTARCREKLGDLAGARSLYTRIVAELLPTTAPPAWHEAQSSASAELDSLEARLATPVLPLEAPVVVPAKPAASSEASPPLSPTTRSAPPPVTPEKWSPTRVGGTVAFGVGALGLVTGLVSGGAALVVAADIRKGCSGTSCLEEDESRAVGARELADWATVGFIVAGAGAAVGVSLWLVPEPNQEPRVSLSLRPFGAELSGRF